MRPTANWYGVHHDAHELDQTQRRCAGENRSFASALEAEVSCRQPWWRRGGGLRRRRLGWPLERVRLGDGATALRQAGFSTPSGGVHDLSLAGDAAMATQAGGGPWHVFFLLCSTE
ncbi:hypothetical protein BS78_02G117900 [Paspalum vaginatum]|nr:hypothetical protein BS78_02G117900 [Paspalum vaginatum]